MQTTASDPKLHKTFRLPGRLALAALALGILVLLAGSWLLMRPWSAGGSQPPMRAVSTTQLAEQYGVRINLLAVTAAGGMLDLRYQVLDAQKAQSLFAAPSAAPKLYIPQKHVSLATEADPRQQYPALKDGNLYLVMFTNNGNAVKVGDEIEIRFGDLQVTSIRVK